VQNSAASGFPFSAIVGSDDMALALVLAAISPEIGGVLVRGEKGTAKTTMVRGLAAVLPDVAVVEGCRFSCDPHDPDPLCPDGPHRNEPETLRPARLVELPVGATEDRVIGSLDLQQVLGAGHVTYQPGLLAEAHRGILYVDEVNLLHDHLVDLLLDAVAMGRSTVEREGVSVAHASRVVLVGTMNPEEGELRPQLLDRFGLTVEVAAPRDPGVRAEVIRRRLAYERDPEGFAAGYASAEDDLGRRIRTARATLGTVRLTDAQLVAIARVCAGFEVDGMRADIVTARAAVAHAAWHHRSVVERADLRAAARLALPHRRRRNPFDAPGLDEDLLDRLLDTEPDPRQPDPSDPGPGPADPNPPDAAQRPGTQPDTTRPDATRPSPASASVEAPGQSDQACSPPDSADTDPARPDLPGETRQNRDQPAEAAGAGRNAEQLTIARAGEAYRTKRFVVSGIGTGESGRRSRALTSTGRTVGVSSFGRGGSGLHLPGTIRAAAPHQRIRGRTAGELRLAPTDLRRPVTEGRESNLVLFAVDASGSMAARRRMEAVKTAVLSLLLDAYQRRDKVGLVTFRGDSATLALPPTSSVEAAARRLDSLPAGGRTPLAEGLLCAAETLRIERIKDPRRRALLVLVTDGRATSGPDPVHRSRLAADHVRRAGVDSVVVDCETGRIRLGLAEVLSAQLGGHHIAVEEVAAGLIVDVVRRERAA
jgi:magnesium chelatase subunit D